MLSIVRLLNVFPMENDELSNEQILQEELKKQCSNYMAGIKAMKEAAVLEAQGPADVPSLLVIRFLAKPGNEGDSLVLASLDENTLICEKVYNMSSYAGKDVRPGSVVGSMLNEFWATQQVKPITVGVVADSISIKPDKDEEFYEVHGHTEKSMHEIFMDDPLASQWLSEALNIFIMDSHGHMASISSFYEYPDDQKPPKPRYEDGEPFYDGLLFDMNPEDIKGQRIILQIALFFAVVESLQEAENRQNN